MPSAYSSSLRLELQATGENVNIWGARLDTAIERVDTSIAGIKSLALTSDYTLTTSNTGEDDSRAAVLKFTGGAGPYTITLPSVSKIYKIWNASSATLTITTGSGSTVQIATTDIVEIFCDGTNVKTLGYGGNSLKDYIASVVVGGGASLPSLSGNSGKWLTNNGTNASWALPTVTDISNYASDQATKTAAATGLAIAFAVTL